MKVAVIGCGGLGHIHAAAYQHMMDVELTAVCDIIADRADELAAETGATAYYTMDEMLEKAEFDVISVTVPSNSHKEMTVKAAQAGKHVISEKPIALSVADTQEMIAVCAANHVQFFVAHVVRFYPEYVQIKQVIAQGKLGQIGTIHTKRSGGHPALVKSWYGDVAQSGGVIVDLLVHDIDFLRWAVGEVKSVYAMGYRTEQLEFAFVTLEFECGAIANLEGVWGHPLPFHTMIEVAGSKGIIRNSSDQCDPININLYKSKEEKSRFVAVPKSAADKSPYELELEHFLLSIRTGATPIVTADDASLALEIALAAEQSIHSGQRIRIDRLAEGAVTK